MANIIKIKRGLSSNISNATLEQGELAITTDTQDLYVGTDSGNKKVGGGPKNILDGTKSGSIRTINSAVEDSTYTLGKNAFSEGSGTRASGTNSHAEGSNALASGDRAHAEGELTVASGTDSHAEGYHTKASNFYSHAEGVYTTASGNHSHAEGAYTIAQGDSQHVQGKYNIADTTSAHIVGNGDNTTQSNAHTIDWSGNAWFAGDVYTGSTSGTNKDSGSKKLATEEYATNLVSDTGWIISTNSEPNGVCTYNHGQVINGLQVRKVGKIVYLNLTLSLNLIEEATSDERYLLILNEKYRPIQAIYFTALPLRNNNSIEDAVQPCVITILPDGRVEIINHKEVARKQSEVGGNTLSLNQLVSYPV